MAAIPSLAACGGEPEGADEPADLVPAGAPIYLEASIADPEQRDAAAAFIEELGRVPVLGATLDPEALAADALEEDAAEEGVDFSYERDVEPWLGERAAIAFLSFAGFQSDEGTEVLARQDEGTEEEFVLLVEVTDSDAARESLTRLAEESPDSDVEEGEIAGEPALRDTDTGTGGIVFADGYLLVAPTDEIAERALAAPGEEPLSESDALAAAEEGLPAERLGFGFVDLAAAVSYAEEEGGAAPQEIAALRALYGSLLEEPLSFALTAEARSLALDFATSPPEGLAAFGGVAESVADAPAGAFASLGLGDLGEQVSYFLEQLPELDETARAQLDAAAEAFEAQVGLPLDEAVDAFGEGSLWVGGELPDEFAAGLEIAVDEASEAPETLLRAAEDAARGELPARLGGPLGPATEGFSATVPAGSGEPGYLSLGLVGDRLLAVAASDRAAAEGALGGSLGEDELFREATGALEGFELSSYVELEPILELATDEVSALDVVAGDASAESLVLDYLTGKLAYAAAGVREDGERSVQRLLIALR